MPDRLDHERAVRLAGQAARRYGVKAPVQPLRTGANYVFRAGELVIRVAPQSADVGGQVALAKWLGSHGPTASSIRAVDPVSGVVRVLRDCPLRFGPPSYTDCNVGGPRYSPDGRTIAFTTIQTTPDFTGRPWQSDPGLATMASDGSFTARRRHRH